MGFAIHPENFGNGPYILLPHCGGFESQTPLQ